MSVTSCVYSSNLYGRLDIQLLQLKIPIAGVSQDYYLQKQALVFTTATVAIYTNSLVPLSMPCHNFYSYPVRTPKASQLLLE